MSGYGFKSEKEFREAVRKMMREENAGRTIPRGGVNPQSIGGPGQGLERPIIGFPGKAAAWVDGRRYLDMDTNLKHIVGTSNLAAFANTNTELAVLFSWNNADRTNGPLSQNDWGWGATNGPVMLATRPSASSTTWKLSGFTTHYWNAGPLGAPSGGGLGGYGTETGVEIGSFPVASWHGFMWGSATVKNSGAGGLFAASVHVGAGLQPVGQQTILPGAQGSIPFCGIIHGISPVGIDFLGPPGNTDWEVTNISVSIHLDGAQVL